MIAAAAWALVWLAAGVLLAVVTAAAAPDEWKATLRTLLGDHALPRHSGAGGDAAGDGDARADPRAVDAQASRMLALPPDVRMAPAALLATRWQLPRAVATEVGTFIELLVRDFVVSWYRLSLKPLPPPTTATAAAARDGLPPPTRFIAGITDDADFLSYLQFVITNALGSLAFRVSAVQPILFLVDDVSEVLRQHVAVYDAMVRRAARKDPALFAPMTDVALLAAAHRREAESGAAILAEADALERERRRRTAAQEAAIVAELAAADVLHGACDVRDTPLLRGEPGAGGWGIPRTDRVTSTLPLAPELARQQAYLRPLVEQVMARLLPAADRSSPAVTSMVREILVTCVLGPGLDAGADPDTLNFLTTFAYDYLTGATTTGADTAAVEGVAAGGSDAELAGDDDNGGRSGGPLAAPPSAPAGAAARGSKSTSPALGGRREAGGSASSSPVRNSTRAAPPPPPPLPTAPTALPPPPQTGTGAAAAAAAVIASSGAAAAELPLTAAAAGSPPRRTARSSAVAVDGAAAGDGGIAVQWLEHAGPDFGATPGIARQTSEAAWAFFAGPIARDDAERYLLAVRRPGAFLLRSIEGGTLMLSYTRLATSGGSSVGTDSDAAAGGGDAMASSGFSMGSARVLRPDADKAPSAAADSAADTVTTLGESSLTVGHTIVKLEGTVFTALQRGPFRDLTGLLRGLRDVAWLGVAVETHGAGDRRPSQSSDAGRGGGGDIALEPAPATAVTVRVHTLYRDEACCGPAAASAVRRELQQALLDEMSDALVEATPLTAAAAPAARSARPLSLAWPLSGGSAVSAPGSGLSSPAATASGKVTASQPLRKEASILGALSRGLFGMGSAAGSPAPAAAAAARPQSMPVGSSMRSLLGPTPAPAAMSDARAVPSQRGMTAAAAEVAQVAADAQSAAASPRQVASSGVEASTANHLPPLQEDDTTAAAAAAVPAPPPATTASEATAAKPAKPRFLDVFGPLFAKAVRRESLHHLRKRSSGSLATAAVAAGGDLAGHTVSASSPAVLTATADERTPDAAAFDMDAEAEMQAEAAWARIGTDRAARSSASSLPSVGAARGTRSSLPSPILAPVREASGSGEWQQRLARDRRSSSGANSGGSGDADAGLPTFDDNEGDEDEGEELLGDEEGAVESEPAQDAAAAAENSSDEEAGESDADGARLLHAALPVPLFGGGGASSTTLAPPPLIAVPSDGHLSSGSERSVPVLFSAAGDRAASAAPASLSLFGEPHATLSSPLTADSSSALFGPKPTAALADAVESGRSGGVDAPAPARAPVASAAVSAQAALMTRHKKKWEHKRDRAEVVADLQRQQRDGGSGEAGAEAAVAAAATTADDDDGGGEREANGHSPRRAVSSRKRASIARGAVAGNAAAAGEAERARAEDAAASMATREVTLMAVLDGMPDAPAAGATAASGSRDAPATGDTAAGVTGGGGPASPLSLDDARRVMRMNERPRLAALRPQPAASSGSVASVATAAAALLQPFTLPSSVTSMFSPAIGSAAAAAAQASPPLTADTGSGNGLDGAAAAPAALDAAGSETGLAPAPLEQPTPAAAAAALPPLMAHVVRYLLSSEAGEAAEQARAADDVDDGPGTIASNAPVAAGGSGAPAPSSAAHVLYVVRVECGDLGWSTRLRYSQFRSLYLALRGAVPAFSAKFPDKTIISVTDVAFVTARLQALESWLQAVLADDRVNRLAEVAALLLPTDASSIRRRRDGDVSGGTAASDRGGRPAARRKRVTFSAAPTSGDGDAADAAGGTVAAVALPRVVHRDLTRHDFLRIEHRVFALINEVFDLASHGWMRRKMIGVTRTMVRLMYTGTAADRVSSIYHDTFSASTIAGWIASARDQVLWPNGEWRTPAPQSTWHQQWQARAASLAVLQTSCPSALHSLLGRDCVISGISRLHAMMQIPVLARSLVFSLLDIAILRLFPDIRLPRGSAVDRGLAAAASSLASGAMGGVASRLERRVSRAALREPVAPARGAIASSVHMFTNATGTGLSMAWGGVNHLVRLGASGASAIAGGVTAGFGAVTASLGAASATPAPPPAPVEPIDDGAVPRTRLQRDSSGRGPLPSHLMR